MHRKEYEKLKKKHSTPAISVSDRKLHTQLRTAATALRTVLCAAFGDRRPADRTLSTFFRENRQCGSRDRQFINEEVFAVWREWGTLRRLLTDERREAVESGRSGPSARELELLLAGAARLEKMDFPAVHLLLEKLPAETMLQRIPGEELPEWVGPLVPPEFPLARYRERLLLRPPMWLRAQVESVDELASALTARGVPVRRHDRVRKALAVENARVNLFTLPEFRAGQFEVQDLASQAIGLAAAPRAGERWLDACAGAGGKTLQLADLMERRGTVVASDIRAYKLEDLRRRARRAGFPNIVTREWDGKPFRGRRKESFDGVLVDAPCSCSGVWRRNPDGRWVLRPEEVAETARLQSSLLSAAATAVRPGGVLIYATCSIFAMENRERVREFLVEHADFSPEAFAHPLTGAPVSDGCLQLGPEDGDCDAMFVARLRRRPVREAEKGGEEIRTK